MFYVLIKHFLLIYVLTHAMLFMMSVMMMMIPFDEDNEDNKSGYASGQTYLVINQSLKM